MASPRHNPKLINLSSIDNVRHTNVNQSKDNIWSTYSQKDLSNQMNRSVSLQAISDKVPVYKDKLWKRQMSLSSNLQASHSAHNLWSLANDKVKQKERDKSTEENDLHRQENRQDNLDQMQFHALECGFSDASVEYILQGHNAPLASSHNVLPAAEVEKVTAKLYNLTSGRRLSVSHDSLTSMTVSKL